MTRRVSEAPSTGITECTIPRENPSSYGAAGMFGVEAAQIFLIDSPPFGKQKKELAVKQGMLQGEWEVLHEKFYFISLVPVPLRLLPQLASPQDP